MKILHILTSGSVGGIEKQCYNELISSDNHYYLYIKRVGIFCEKSLEYGRSYYVFDGNVKLSLKQFSKVYNKIIEIIKENNIDRVVIEHAADLCLLVALKLIRKHYNVYVYQHSSYEDHERKNILITKASECLYKKCVKKSKGIIAISEYVKDSIIKCLKVDKYKDNIHVIYNGMIISDNKPKEKSNDCIKFLYVGRIIEEKGIPHIIDCLQNIKYNYKFYVVGDGPLLNQYKEKYKDDNIIFVGETNKVDDYYNKCDIFVHLPNWNEGFGITLIEAMNYGLPIISNYKGAIPEIVKNNVTGILLNDNNQFNKAVESIIENYNSYSIKSIEESEKYDIKNTLKGIENL